MRRDRTRAFGCGAVIAAYAGAMAVALWLLCSCGRPALAPALSVRAESIEHGRAMASEGVETEKESVRESAQESTTVTVNDRGDTLRTDRVVRYIRDRTAEKENRRLTSVIDSLKSLRQDTVREPYAVERPLTRWEQAKMDFGGMAMGACAATLILAAIGIARNIRQRHR